MTRDVKSLQANANLSQARDMMDSEKIRQIPVVDADNQLVGLVSKRDIYAASVSNLSENFERGKALIEGRLMVSDVMTQNVASISSDQRLADAAVKLQELRVGALPVVEEGKLVGIISSSDFLGIAVMLLDK
jgi:CBS domain-containing protein